VIGARYTQPAAESAAQPHITSLADSRTDSEAHEDDFINEIMDQLGDTIPRSRPTYRLILRTFGTHRTYRLVGQAKEAYRDGLVEQTMPSYFMGIVKKVAAHDGIPLPFRSHPHEPMR